MFQYLLRLCLLLLLLCVFPTARLCLHISTGQCPAAQSHTHSSIYSGSVDVTVPGQRETCQKKRYSKSNSYFQPLISLSGRFPSPFHSAPLLLHWLSIPLTSFISFSSLPRGVYRQLHYSSGTNSHSTLNMYPLKLALVAAVGDISHFLLNRKKKTKKQLRQCLPSHVNHSKL